MGGYSDSIYLDYSCQFAAEWSQDGMNLGFDIAVKIPHYLKALSLHEKHRKFNDLLVSRLAINLKCFFFINDFSMVHRLQNSHLWLDFCAIFVIASGLKIENQQAVKVLRYPMIKRNPTTRLSGHVVGKRERATTI